ncbi:hypothetical protein IV203_030359 [Nitzschia inconspicua]|uniref:Uncharacterized protein n=1 Tax=Nitzschia inconspicua TaxID=303405 RepID=A0A9K3LSE7_9STRA|nr:hypothetical protein IV203_030359 [Nitzschia inconspicua]
MLIGPLSVWIRTILPHPSRRTRIRSWLMRRFTFGFLRENWEGNFSTAARYKLCPSLVSKLIRRLIDRRYVLSLKDKTSSLKDKTSFLRDKTLLLRNGNFSVTATFRRRHLRNGSDDRCLIDLRYDGQTTSDRHTLTGRDEQVVQATVWWT